jgi:hypothetical protein
MNARILTKIWSLLSVMLVLSLVAAPVAFADYVWNNVSNNITDRTITIEQTKTVGYKIIPSSEGDPVSGCNVSPSKTAIVTISSPGVTASAATLTFTACNSIQYVTFTPSMTGTFDISHSISGSYTGVIEPATANFTLTVNPPPDTTPPVITPNIAGTLGSNDWYISNVTLTWNKLDPESPITSSSGCDPITITVDQFATTYTCSATSAGGTASQSVTIKRDATAPTVSMVGGPADGESYYFGEVTPATCTAYDAMSDIAGACSVSGYSAGVGTHTVTASATDNAGNSSSVSRTYTVLAWRMDGFYQPIEMLTGVWNTVKGGSTVPLKFEIFAGDTELTSTSAVTTLTPQLVPCEAGGTEDPIDATATGGTSLRYDTTEGQFIFNWQTPRQPGKCYKVTMTAQDGSSISAYMKLK